MCFTHSTSTEPTRPSALKAEAMDLYPHVDGYRDMQMVRNHFSKIHICSKPTQGLCNPKVTDRRGGKAIWSENMQRQGLSDSHERNQYGSYR